MVDYRGRAYFVIRYVTCLQLLDSAHACRSGAAAAMRMMLIADSHPLFLGFSPSVQLLKCQLAAPP